jgi:hypothetical protein
VAAARGTFLLRRTRDAPAHAHTQTLPPSSPVFSSVTVLRWQFWHLMRRHWACRSERQFYHALAQLGDTAQGPVQGSERRMGEMPAWTALQYPKTLEYTHGCHAKRSVFVFLRLRLRIVRWTMDDGMHYRLSLSYLSMHYTPWYMALVRVRYSRRP